MSPYHRNENRIWLLLIPGFIMGLSNCEFMKQNVCVLFEFDNHVDNRTAVIGSIAGTTKSRCFLSCVRNSSCEAFQLRPKDGNCELLETPEKCMTQNIMMGTVFVQLTKCDGKPPWKVVSPTLNKLQWRGHYNIGDRKAVRTRNGERSIVRVLYQGIYLLTLTYQ